LASLFGVKKIDPGHVATGARQARDQSERYRILAYTEHDWDGRRGGLGGERASGVGGHCDHRDVAADRIVEDCDNLFVATIQPVILDDDVLAFRKPRLAQGLRETQQQARWPC
jgi:hypothetical protein